MRVFFEIFICHFWGALECLFFDNMAFYTASKGRLQLGDFVLLSERILLASLLFGLYLVKAFDYGIDVVAHIFEAVQCVDSHLSGQLSSIFIQIVRVLDIFNLLVLLPLDVRYWHLHAQAL